MEESLELNLLMATKKTEMTGIFEISKIEHFVEEIGTEAEAEADKGGTAHGIRER